MTKPAPGYDFKTIPELREILKSFSGVAEKKEWLSGLPPEKIRMAGDVTTTAHAIAEMGLLPSVFLTKEIFSLTDKRTWKVAHSLAYMLPVIIDKFTREEQEKISSLFSDPEILLMSDENGWTVAHELARQGFLPKTGEAPDIFGLKDKNGFSVFYIAAKHGHLPAEFIDAETAKFLMSYGTETLLEHFAKRLRVLFRRDGHKSVTEQVDRLPKETLPILISLLEGKPKTFDIALLKIAQEAFDRHSREDAAESLSTEGEETDLPEGLYEVRFFEGEER